MYKTEDDMEGDCTENGIFFENPHLTFVLDRECFIMGVIHSYPNGKSTYIIQDTQAGPDDYLLPDYWEEGEWWVTSVEYKQDVKAVEALDEDEIEEIEGWGIRPTDLESLKDPNTKGELLYITVENRDRDDYNYETIEYKFYMPEDWL